MTLRTLLTQTVAILILAASNHTTAHAQSTPAQPLASTTHGKIRGSITEDIHVFKGIPYGASTAGANRFKPPQPPAPWSETRDALEYGDQCPQMPPTGGNESPDDTTPTSEDCLVLNVWTPGLRDGKRRPVMVWLHGGGYVSGSGASPLYDGTRLAKRGDVVIVTLNHRLNVFGHLYLGELGGAEYADSGNVGQLDIVLALQWVRDNIEEFGGDPGRVTVFGESGGGGKVGTLMAMPLAKGLFHRAILQSGFGITAIPSADATKTAEGVLKELKLSRKQIDRLQHVPADELIAALRKVTGGTPLGVGPVLDGRSVPRHPFMPDAPELSADVPVLVGWNKDETTVLFPPPDAFNLDWAGLSRHLTSALPRVDIEKLVARLRQIRPEASPSDLYFTVTTELGMGNNARTLATRKARQGAAPVYLYRLEWETPVDGGKLRAHHGLDIPLMFDNVGKSPGLRSSKEAQRVADAMSEAWLNFAWAGNPNGPGLSYWPAFDPETQPTMVFDVVSRAVSDPIREVRLLLENPPMIQLTSEELARQPQTRKAKGDQQRHYYFKAAKQEMPYRLYVPSSYDPKKPSPLVVALHGYGGNQDYFFRLVPNLKELCEQYGFIFVAPMGYSIGGWYGAPLSIPGNYPRSTDGSRPRNASPPAPIPEKSPEEALRERELSEQDVLNVLDLVRKEYNVDPKRIYLMGHSMGGMGTYFLGQKHAHIWAAIAPMSAAMAGVDYAWPRLKDVPVHISVGSTETRTVATSKEQIETLKQMGMTAAYLEVPGGTHVSMVAPAVPDIFEFFSRYSKK
jgi:para-nitrobenzyl esterase